MTAGLEQRLVRAPVVAVYDTRDALVSVGDGEARALTGGSAARARAVLAFALEPRTRGEILAHIAERAGEAVGPGGVVDQLLELLLQHRVLVAASAERPRVTPARP